MMKTTNFKRKLIASAIATSALSGWSYTAQAQEGDANTNVDDSPEVLEEILVTGIRASLERAMDRKRMAQGVVDAISAEDMGEFPDTNLAESLQRITGVSIDRRDGEGSKVTVRGLGPDFNLVTLNGRQMPGASIDATSASGSRSFDFANLASEGVAAVEVYKTARADVPSGGLGAAINIVTPRPLTADDQASITAKGVYDDSSEDASVTPEISGIFSRTFMDGKLGVAVTGSYQEREGGNRSALVGTGWRSFPGTVVQDWGGEQGVDFAWGGIDFNNGNHINQPAPEDVYSTPQAITYRFEEFERTRTNGQLTLQFAPIEDFVATLDYTVSENEIDREFNDAGFWFNFGGQNTIFTDFESPAVQTPILYSDNAANDIAMAAGNDSQLFENESIGVNFKWDATDTLRFSLDAHSSTAEAGPNSPFGNSNGVAVSAFVRDRTTGNFRGSAPGVALDVTTADGDRELEVEDLQVSGSFFRNSQTEHDIDQVQFDGEWDFADWGTVNFGVGRIEGEFESAFSNVQRDTWGGLGDPGQFIGNEGIFTKETIVDEFDADFGQTSQEEIEFLGGSNPEQWNQRFSFDVDDVRSFAAQNFDDGSGPADCADGSSYYCTIAPDNFNRVEEDIDSVYVSVDIERTLMDRFPYTVNLGFRYEETSVESPSTVETFGPIRWVAVNEFTLPATGSEETTFDGDYDVTLPNIDFKINLTDDLVARASYGESLARPNWLDITGGRSVDQLARTDGATGRRGNPGLSPIQSENIDLSLEWYYGNGSFASIGYFDKAVEDFIGNRVVREEGPLDNTPHPFLGERAQAAIDSGIAPNDVGAIRQFIFDNFPDPETAFQNSNGDIIIVGIPGEDPNTPVEFTEVSNEEDADIDGWEFQVQHNFWDTGFGVIANYTIVNESTGFDNLDASNAPQFAITGVSDTANLVAFYDKHGFQVRLAYNWRDDFLASTASGTGNNPVNVDDFAQLDISASYDVTDNLSIFLEGVNVGDASTETFGRHTLQTLGVFENGPRYQLGARYKF